MDNSDFLSHFNKLSDDNSNDTILQSASMIINILESKLKFEKDHKHPDPLKYKLYLKVSQTPNEDILYTLKRLV